MTNSETVKVIHEDEMPVGVVDKPYEEHNEAEDIFNHVTEVSDPLVVFNLMHT